MLEMNYVNMYLVNVTKFLILLVNQETRNYKDKGIIVECTQGIKNLGNCNEELQSL